MPHEREYTDTLPEGYRLHWYEFKSILGRGGFGITYLAMDQNLKQKVAIKEYLPTDIASRKGNQTVHPITEQHGDLFQWGLDRFLKEARTLAQFKHPNIVRVFSVFEQNNTAYMVMEYEQGQDLSTLFKEKKAKSLSWSEQELLNIYLPILEGLSLIHDAGFIHRDAKPANIYIRTEGAPVLIDFGSARQTMGEKTQALTSLVTYGYAPFEQYNDSGGKQGPGTDIYSLGASIYKAITGKLPVDALTRATQIYNENIDPYQPLSELVKEGYSYHFLLAVDHALMFRSSDRPQNVTTWSEMLTGNIQVKPIHTPEPPAEIKKKPTSKEATIVRPKTYNNPSSSDTTAINIESNQKAAPNTKATGEKEVKNKGLIIGIFFIVAALILGVVFSPPKNDLIPKVEKEPVIVTSTPTKPVDSAKASPIKKIDNNEEINLKVAAHISFQEDSKAQTNKELPSKPLIVKTPEPEKKPKPVIELQEQQIRRLLTTAKRYVNKGQILRPKGNNAISTYNQVLALEPKNRSAIKGIKQILIFYADEVDSLLDKNNLKRAEQVVENIILIDPSSTYARAVQKKVNRAKEKKHKKEEHFIPLPSF